jgi:cytochrome c-type biogenesis protein CcmI
MTLWLILTIMTAAAAIWASVPLIRRFDRSQAESVSDIEIYRDQLQEVVHELRQGLIDDTQAEMVRVEIKRRILAADSSRASGGAEASDRQRNARNNESTRRIADASGSCERTEPGGRAGRGGHAAGGPLPHDKRNGRWSCQSTGTITARRGWMDQADPITRGAWRKQARKAGRSRVVSTCLLMMRESEIGLLRRRNSWG